VERRKEEEKELEERERERERERETWMTDEHGEEAATDESTRPLPKPGDRGAAKTQRHRQRPDLLVCFITMKSIQYVCPRAVNVTTSCGSFSKAASSWHAAL
jgi:hypothetical protein